MYISTEQKDIEFIREFLKRKGKKYNALKSIYDDKTLLKYKDNVHMFYQIILSDLKLTETDFTLRGLRNWMAIEVKKIEGTRQNNDENYIKISDESEKENVLKTATKFNLTESQPDNRNKKLLTKPQKVN